MVWVLAAVPAGVMLRRSYSSWTLHEAMIFPAVLFNSVATFTSQALASLAAGAAIAVLGWRNVNLAGIPVKNMAPTGFDAWEVVPGQGQYYNPDFITPTGKIQRRFLRTP